MITSIYNGMTKTYNFLTNKNENNDVEVNFYIRIHILIYLKNKIYKIYVGLTIKIIFNTWDLIFVTIYIK